METGFRVLLLTAVLMTLPGCASVRDWIHHRSEVRQAKAEAKEEAAQQAAQDAAAGRGRHAAARDRTERRAAQDQGTPDPQLEHRDRRPGRLHVHRRLRYPERLRAHARLPRDRRLLFPGRVRAAPRRAGPASRRWAATSSCLPQLRDASRITTFAGLQLPSWRGLHRSQSRHDELLSICLGGIGARSSPATTASP